MTGVLVQYCGHKGSFVADVFEVAGAYVVRPNGPIDLGNLDRQSSPEYWVTDYPEAGFWRPDLGVLVVPKEQLVKMETS